MGGAFAESVVETAVLVWLAGLGHAELVSTGEGRWSPYDQP